MKCHASRTPAFSVSPLKTAILLGSVGAIYAGAAGAAEFSFGEGGKAQIDTSVSYGAAWRVEDQDKDLAAQGTYAELVSRNVRTFANKNDGDANFDNSSTPVSSTARLNVEMEIQKGNYGGFIRGNAFYDAAVMDDTYPDGNNFSNALKSNRSAYNGANADVAEYAGHRAEIMAAYVYGKYDIGSMPLDVRVGEQVLNWGEALFMTDSLNAINPLDLSRLRLPGAEVKDVLLPLPMLTASLGLTDSLSLDTFAAFDWEAYRPDAEGTYYSTDDAFAGAGADFVRVDMSTTSASGLTALYNMNAYGMSGAASMLKVLTHTRLNDVAPGDNGQMGLSLKWNVGETEIGVYAMNVHSKKPVANGVAGKAFGAASNAAACSTVRQATASTGISGITGAITCSEMTAAMAQQAVATLGGKTVYQYVYDATFAATSNTGVSISQASAAQSGVTTAVGGANAVYYLDTTQYQLVYPEDINVYGLSFSSTLGDYSVSGELAYRPKDWIIPELGDNLVAYNSVYASTIANGGSASMGAHLNDGKPISAGQTFADALEVETYNLSLVGIGSFNNGAAMIGASDLKAILELGASHIAGLKDNLDYASTASLLYIPAFGLAEGDGKDTYMDDTSWGYRLVLSATYNDVFGGVNLNPVLRFAHDVEGNSHRTGNFMEGRRSGSVGLNAIYNQALEVGLGYNTFWGAGLSNLVADRDNVTLSLKYSF